MKKMLVFLFCILPVCCQTGKKPAESSSDGISTTIHLTEAIDKAGQVFLSEIADSISLIALETDDLSLLGNYLNFKFIDDYIFAYNCLFDWEGKFIGNLVQKGQGPCEEPNAQYISNVIFKDKHFYTFATKIIQYDSLMQCTGKERILYRLELDGERPVAGSTMTNIGAVANAKENIILYAGPDSVIFMDTAFTFISSRQVLYPTLSSLSLGSSIGVASKYLTSYGNQTLFYNFFNDTVYNVGNDCLTPAWIVELSDKRRVPNDLRYRGEELMRGAFKAWESGTLDHCELVRLTDNKVSVTGVYETSRYVFLVWSEMIQVPTLRNKQEPTPQIAFFDKQTGKTKSTKENGFVDDLLDMDTYLPLWGAYNDMLIQSMWPHELHGYIEECNRSGRKVNPKLLDFAQKVLPDDNPVLIVAHLKK